MTEQWHMILCYTWVYISIQNVVIDPKAKELHKKYTHEAPLVTTQSAAQYLIANINSWHNFLQSTVTPSPNTTHHCTDGPDLGQAQGGNESENSYNSSDGKL